MRLSLKCLRRRPSLHAHRQRLQGQAITDRRRGGWTPVLTGMPKAVETMHTVWLQRPRICLLAVQCAALLVAAAFLWFAIAGFIPGLTTQSRLFGVFEISILHNLLHLAFGVVGFALAGTYGRARAYLV